VRRAKAGLTFAVCSTLPTHQDRSSISSDSPGELADGPPNEMNWAFTALERDESPVSLLLLVFARKGVLAIVSRLSRCWLGNCRRPRSGLGIVTVCTHFVTPCLTWVNTRYRDSI
jgi:hypothetical protein